MAYSFDSELVNCIPNLQRYACKLTRDASSAEDLTQDCLARALSRSHRFEPGTNMQAWLTTMLKNLHFNNLQRDKHVTKVELSDSHVGRALPDLPAGFPRCRPRLRQLDSLPA